MIVPTAPIACRTIAPTPAEVPSEVCVCSSCFSSKPVAHFQILCLLTRNNQQILSIVSVPNQIRKPYGRTAQTVHVASFAGPSQVSPHPIRAFPVGLSELFPVVE